MRVIVWVGLGSALGGVGRVLVGEAVAGWLGSAFPWGTLAANLAGSALIGAIAALTGPDGRWLLAPEKRLFLMAGVCGGFTTFSFFSLQTWTLIETGHARIAILYSLATVIGGVAAAWLGYQTAKRS